MKAEEKKLFEYIRSSDNHFKVPPYQRTYHWESNDIKKLIDDLNQYILKPIQEENIYNQYYIGNLIVKRKDDNSLILIDGQQRITSCILIAKALYNRLNELDKNKENQTLLIELKSVFCHNGDPKKLKLNNIHNESVLEKIINDCEVSIENNFTKNYKYLTSFFKRNNLEEIKDYIMAFQKLSCAVIQLDSKENEHLIFESINSKGKKLLQSDLIKNYIFFLCSDNGEISYYYNNIFLKNFKDHKEELDFYRLFDCCTLNKPPESKNGSKIYESIKRKYDSNKDEVKFTIKDMDEIKKFYAIYHMVKNIKFNSSSEYIVNSAFATYFPWIYNVFKHYLTEEMYTIDGQNIKIEIDKNLQKKISEHFIVMATYDILRIFNGFGRVEAAKTIHKFFSEMLQYFNEQNIDIEDTSVNDKIKFFESKNEIKAYLIPKNFDENIYKMDMYNESQRLNVILWLYEQNSRKTDKESYKNFTKRYNTIEHILPRNAKNNNHWSDYYKQNEMDEIYKKINTIGNLTLQEKSTNSHDSDKSFEDKRNSYKNSFLEINRKIAEYNCWNMDTIKDRTEQIKSFITTSLISSFW